MLPNFELEQEIITETQAWSKTALEVVNENYNNLPPWASIKSIINDFSNLKVLSEGKLENANNEITFEERSWDSKLQ